MFRTTQCGALPGGGEIWIRPIHQIIGTAIQVHKYLGPGLLETAYQWCLEIEFTAPAEHPKWGLFPGGSAWLCRHLWDKYLFHPNPTYLEKIYPTLKEASLFYFDTMHQDAHSNYLYRS
jgi:hypothetical protein